LLLGVKGEQKCPPRRQRPSSWINAQRGKHSEKPTEVYDLIETMYPALPKLELFARKRRQGWTAWGRMEPESGVASESRSPLFR
jgi:N6-adenosine-specific RNA methylase IME4